MIGCITGVYSFRCFPFLLVHVARWAVTIFLSFHWLAWWTLIHWTAADVSHVLTETVVRELLVVFGITLLAGGRTCDARWFVVARRVAWVGSPWNSRDFCTFPGWWHGLGRRWVVARRVALIGIQ